MLPEYFRRFNLGMGIFSFEVLVRERELVGEGVCKDMLADRQESNTDRGFYTRANTGARV